MSNAILDEYRQSRDTGDLWACTLEAWFTIADAMTMHGEYPPDDWEYSPGAVMGEGMWDDDSPGGDRGIFLEDHGGTYAELCLDLEPQDRMYAGRVIAKYAELLRANGHSY